jgi:hypothetical protein
MDTKLEFDVDVDGLADMMVMVEKRGIVGDGWLVRRGNR